MTATQFKPSPVEIFVPATGSQAHYILTLQGMPKNDDNRPEAALAIMESMSRKEASTLINTLKKGFEKNFPAKVETTVSAPSVAKGEWHILDSKFYLVAKSQSSGFLYAKERLSGGGFGHAKGIFKKLSPATKVSAANVSEIQAFGHLHDRCVFCYLPLDLPESRTAGYGEKCADNMGLPWG